MNERKDIESVINSEREWRIYIVQKLEKLEDRLASNHAWNLVYRVVGSSLIFAAFTILVVWIETKLKGG